MITVHHICQTHFRIKLKRFHKLNQGKQFRGPTGKKKIKQNGFSLTLTFWLLFEASDLVIAEKVATEITEPGSSLMQKEKGIAVIN